MNKTRRQWMIVLFLLVVFILLLTGRVMKERMSAGEMPKQELSGPALEKDAAVENTNTVGAVRPNKTVAQAESLKRPWGRNPFRPQDDAAGVLDAQSDIGLMLTGISFKGSVGYAILGDHIVCSGMTVQGYDVKRVERDRVVLEKDKEIYVLRMKAEEWL